MGLSPKWASTEASVGNCCSLPPDLLAEGGCLSTYRVLFLKHKSGRITLSSMQPREPGVIPMASRPANPPVTRTPDKRDESPDCSPRKTDEIQFPQPHSPVRICQCPQSKSHFPAHWSSLPLISTMLCAASSDPALPWPPAPFS